VTLRIQPERTRPSYRMLAAEAAAGWSIHATISTSRCSVPRSQGAQKCHDVGHVAALSGRVEGIAERGGEVAVAVEGRAMAENVPV
jgi:hypothetical protein